MNYLVGKHIQMKQLKCPKCGKSFNRFRHIFTLADHVCQNCGERIGLRYLQKTGMLIVIVSVVIGYFQPKNMSLILVFTWMIFGLFDVEATILDKKDSKQNLWQKLWQNKLFLTLFYILLFYLFWLTLG